MDAIFTTILLYPGSSHRKSLLYFAESIGHDNGYGYNCSTFLDLLMGVCSTQTMIPQMMGEHLPKSAFGRCYVVVNWYEPFKRGPDVWGDSERPSNFYQAQAL